jgi:hypothetical protein
MTRQTVYLSADAMRHIFKVKNSTAATEDVLFGDICSGKVSFETLLRKANLHAADMPGLPAIWPGRAEQLGPRCGFYAFYHGLNFSHAGKHSWQVDGLFARGKDLGLTSLGGLGDINHFSALAHSIKASDRDHHQVVSSNCWEYAKQLKACLQGNNVAVISADLEAGTPFPGNSKGDRAHWVLAFACLTICGKDFVLVSQYGKYFLWGMEALARSNYQVRNHPTERNAQGIVLSNFQYTAYVMPYKMENTLEGLLKLSPEKFAERLPTLQAGLAITLRDLILVEDFNLAGCLLARGVKLSEPLALEVAPVILCQVMRVSAADWRAIMDGIIFAGFIQALNSKAVNTELFAVNLERFLVTSSFNEIATRALTSLCKQQTWGFEKLQIEKIKLFAQRLNFSLKVEGETLLEVATKRFQHRLLSCFAEHPQVKPSLDLAGWRLAIASTVGCRSWALGVKLLNQLEAFSLPFLQSLIKLAAEPGAVELFKSVVLKVRGKGLSNTVVK